MISNTRSAYNEVIRIVVSAHRTVLLEYTPKPIPLDVSPGVSLICTVRDEADTIALLLDSMLAQTRAPDEIIVNDCASRDATAQIVAGYIAAGHPIRLVRGGHNIPTGRNNAIRHARHTLIACTDAGLRLDPHWLARIVAPLEAGTADVVGGFFAIAPGSDFELALGATNYRDAHEIDPATFLPFGKSVAFTRASWLHVGGYPAWASHGEDLVFDLALKRAAMRFAFVPDALVHFRPRGSFGALYRQYLLYARGDGVAGLWGKRHAVRYATYATGAALAATRHPLVLALLAASAAGYCRAPLRRVWQQSRVLPLPRRLRALALVPGIRVVGDLAKMIGYPIGRLRRTLVPGLAADIRQYREGQG